MNVKVENLEEGKEYINSKKGEIIAELLLYQLMKQPLPVRKKLYAMLLEEENKAEDIQL